MSPNTLGRSGLNTPELLELRRAIEASTGLAPSGRRLDALSRHVVQRVRSLDMSVQGYLELLSARHHTDEHDRIVTLITNQETSFFRGPEQLTVFDEKVLAGLLASSPVDGVRLWSAACSTGEEALTLAMMVAERSTGNVPTVQIIGSDICRRTIEIAQSGRYPLLAESRLGPARSDRFFRVRGDALVARLDELPPIEFRHHNLVRPAPFSPFDAIFIRNVLFYLSRESQAKVLRNIRSVLKPGGVVVFGANDGVTVPADFLSIGAHCYRSPQRPAPRRLRQ